MATRDEYVSMLKSAALTTGKNMVMAYLTKHIPIVSVKIINPVVSYFVGVVLGIAIKETEFGAFFLFIDLRTSKQGQAFADAALKNFELQKKGSSKERLDAEKELIQKFSAFVKLTN